MALAAGVAASASAQEATFGVRAGLNLSKVAVSGEAVDGNLTTDNLAGFHVGVVADIKLNEHFYFQPGLMFSTKGGKESESALGVSVTTTMNPSYIELPLMLSLKLPLGDDVAVRINAGPYAAYGLFGKAKIEAGSTSVELDLFEKVEGADKAMLKRLDYGVGFSGGVEFKQLYLGVSYDFGLANLLNVDDADNAKMKYVNQTIGISLGYNF